MRDGLHVPVRVLVRHADCGEVLPACGRVVDVSWACRGRVVGVSAGVPRGGGGAGRVEAEECVVSGDIEQEMCRHTHVAEDGHHGGGAVAVAREGARKQREELRAEAGEAGSSQRGRRAESSG